MECVEYVKSNFIKDLKELIKHDKETFGIPKKWHNSSINEVPLLNSFDELWNELSGLYEKELKALAYSEIPTSNKIKIEIEGFIRFIKNQL